MLPKKSVLSNFLITFGINAVKLHLGLSFRINLTIFKDLGKILCYLKDASLD